MDSQDRPAGFFKWLPGLGSNLEALLITNDLAYVPGYLNVHCLTTSMPGSDRNGPILCRCIGKRFFAFQLPRPRRSFTQSYFVYQLGDDIGPSSFKALHEDLGELRHKTAARTDATPKPGTRILIGGLHLARRLDANWPLLGCNRCITRSNHCSLTS